MNPETDSAHNQPTKEAGGRGPWRADKGALMERMSVTFRNEAGKRGQPRQLQPPTKRMGGMLREERTMFMRMDRLDWGNLSMTSSARTVDRGDARRKPDFQTQVNLKNIKIPLLVMFPLSSENQ